jgi:hypothetical protein
MRGRNSELQAGKLNSSGAVSGLTAVMLVVGLSQTGCAIEALVGAVLRAALGLLPELVLNGWCLVQGLHSGATASLCGEVAGAAWPMLAGVITRI